MPNVSVIIPVYNTEKYLRRCLDSVCNQTLKDLEIICVNDGSTDGSAAILADYAAGDSRIRVITFAENQGAAAARNAGIEAATGAYVGFIDSDDWPDVNLYESLYQSAIQTDSDIAKASYRYSDGYENPELNDWIRRDKNAFSFEYCSAVFSRRLFGGPDGVRFPALIDMEDPLFAISCAARANGISVVDGTYLNVRKRLDSQTAGVPSLARLQDRAKGVLRIFDIAQQTIIEDEVRDFVMAVWFAGLFARMEDYSPGHMQFLQHEMPRFMSRIGDRRRFAARLKRFNGEVAKWIGCNGDGGLVYLGLNRKIGVLESELRANEGVSAQFEGFVREKAMTEMPLLERREACLDIGLTLVSVVNDYAMYDRCIRRNPFVREARNVELVNFDNTVENVAITRRYNAFLDGYDYSRPRWLLFCHCDWEPMEYVRKWLQTADAGNCYGSIGCRIERTLVGDAVYRVVEGRVFERRRDGSGFRMLGRAKGNPSANSPQGGVDTFDCMSFAVHSSLVQKLGFRFDESLSWDLYVEDACIRLGKLGVKAVLMDLDSCHWSGYKVVPGSYRKSLEYMNRKFPDEVFAGTVSCIGGRPCHEVSQLTAVFMNARARMKDAKSALEDRHE